MSNVQEENHFDVAYHSSWRYERNDVWWSAELRHDNEEGIFIKIGPSALWTLHFKLLKDSGNVLLISACLGEAWSATKMQLSDSNQVVLTSGTLAGASPTAAVSGIKRNKEEEKKSPHNRKGIFPLWNYFPVFFTSIAHCFLKSHIKTFIISYNISLFFSKILIFMELSTFTFHKAHFLWKTAKKHA